VKPILLLFVLTACDHSASPPTPRPAAAPPPAVAAPKPSTPAEEIPEPNRPLTTGERAMLKPIFRDGIDYDKVRVIHAAFPFQQRGVYMTPRGHVYAPDYLFRDDFSARTLQGVERAVFVHEMTHVWQYANGMDLIGQGVVEFTKYRGQYEKAYPYLLEPGRDLVEYGMEQQASIVEDYYLITVDHDTPHRIVNHGISTTERDALYARVLDRFFANARYAQALSAKDVADQHAKASEGTKPGPEACKESEAEHGATHMCEWRYRKN
jgi:hypothetical protein